ncbi:hypothetical protein CLAFUW4_10201 [Fulvia fulva]|nr:hypothetical protein CLAFUR4_10205 [Fulvia fulva]KAK4617011.1 hypothetical protein CLAFUR0_10203 [Fulvia fulva]WPV18778.1 hypothetical protein CLAFUW4_10201 [Fulvia fulva]WPV34117.1 hypothetical protein CLAFUW7_10201 [Fulvia fulva]
MQQDTSAFVLLVFNPDGSSDEYFVRGTETVLSLGVEIAYCQGMPVDDQVLTIRGTDVYVRPVQVSPALQLHGLLIGRSTRIELSRMVTVTVRKTWCLETKSLRLFPFDNMGTVVEYILDRGDPRPWQIRVSYKGKQIFRGNYTIDGMRPLDVTLRSTGIADDPFPNLIATLVVNEGSSCGTCAGATSDEGDGDDGDDGDDRDDGDEKDEGDEKEDGAKQGDRDEKDDGDEKDVEGTMDTGERGLFLHSDEYDTS